MTWDEFTTNVRQWSTERGIYEHSTAVAQALKACSEAGELCDAVIKGDREAMIDAVGDVAVCVVNTATMHSCAISLDADYIDDGICLEHGAARVAVYCAMAAEDICTGGMADASLQEVLWSLQDICRSNGLEFLECCESAWLTIKDRRGKMVAGGAFVKE